MGARMIFSDLNEKLAPSPPASAGSLSRDGVPFEDALWVFDDPQDAEQLRQILDHFHRVRGRAYYRRIVRWLGEPPDPEEDKCEAALLARRQRIASKFRNGELIATGVRHATADGSRECIPGPLLALDSTHSGKLGWEYNYNYIVWNGRPNGPQRENAAWTDVLAYRASELPYRNGKPVVPGLDGPSAIARHDSGRVNLKALVVKIFKEKYEGQLTGKRGEPARVVREIAAEIRACGHPADESTVRKAIKLMR
jgi:hypothetical protein